MELKLTAGEVHVYLEHQEMGSWPCPECGANCQLYDHQGERQWRHLDTCQYQTILHAQPRDRIRLAVEIETYQLSPTARRQASEAIVWDSQDQKPLASILEESERSGLPEECRTGKGLMDPRS